MRGVSVENMPEEIILSNTYHLRNLNKNLKKYMGWTKSMLTDSGGFQIQSLPNVEVTDDGVIFDIKLFTPEDSMKIQMMLGAVIMMQLDDVVNPKEEVEKHVKAVDRSIEWLDRAINYINMQNETNASGYVDVRVDNKLEASSSLPGHQVKKSKTIQTIQRHKDMTQTLFPIIQGGLIDNLRLKSIQNILLRNPIGIAIGGLSGGENKNDFCNTVFFCCKNLPDNLPRYIMGVGYPEDIVVCAALGTDMSDCVYPTRTARFGRAFRDQGDITIDSKVLDDLGPIEDGCGCFTCQRHSKSFLATIKGSSNFAMLMSLHNLHYMRNLTFRIRNSILNDSFPDFIKDDKTKRYKKDIPSWIITALNKVNVSIE